MNITQENSYKVVQRGIGLDVTNGCIACDLPTKSSGESQLVNNNSFFVKNLSDGEAITYLFHGRGARLDARAHDRNYIQVKVGACDRHIKVLEALGNAINRNNGCINATVVQTVLSSTPLLEIPIQKTVSQKEFEHVYDFLFEKALKEKDLVESRTGENCVPSVTEYLKNRLGVIQNFLQITKYAVGLEILTQNENQKQ